MSSGDKTPMSPLRGLVGVGDALVPEACASGYTPLPLRGKSNRF